MRLLSTMMLSSNILFCLFLLADYLLGSIPSARWKCNILKTALLVSLFPTAYIWTIIGFIPLKLSLLTDNLSLTLDGHKQFILIAPKEIKVSSSLRIEMVVFIIWFVVGLSIFFHRSSRYLTQKKAVFNSLQIVSEPEQLEILYNCCKMLKLQRAIKLYTCQAKIPPFTMGIWKPVIVLPNNIELDKMELVIHHELCHIKHYDNLFSFIRPLAIGFYWFNPLFYLLDYYLEKITELACDEMVIRSRTTANRKKYCYLILELASSCNEDAGTFATKFCHGDASYKQKNFKERIFYIMKAKRITRRTHIISTLLAIFLVLCSSIPTFAYQAPKKLELSEESGSLIDIAKNETIIFNPAGETVPFSAEPILYDEQFIDSSGIIYNLQSETITPNATCEHSYVDGTYSSHTKKSNGGCVVKYYNAKRCSKCGKLVRGALTNTVTFQVCPH